MLAFPLKAEAVATTPVTHGGGKVQPRRWRFLEIFLKIPVLSSVVAARHQISYFCLKLAVIHTSRCPWRTSPSTLANKGSHELPCK